MFEVYRARIFIFRLRQNLGIFLKILINWVWIILRKNTAILYALKMEYPCSVNFV